MSTSYSRGVRIVLIALGVWVLGVEVSALVPSHPLGHTLFSDWTTEGVQVFAAGLCVVAALRMKTRARVGWLLIAAGIVAWTIGDIYWLDVLHNGTAASVPVPSPADGGYLTFVPLVFAGLVVILRTNASNVPRTLIVDALILGLAAATVSFAFIIRPVAADASGGVWSVATNLAYPIGDLGLLVVVLSAVALRRWRLELRWGLLGAAIVSFLIADTLYLVTTANGTYSDPSFFDVGWVASTILFAAAAWSPVRETPSTAVRRMRMSEIIVPLSLAFVAIMVSLVQPVDREHMITLMLGAACVTAVMARFAMTFAEYMHLYETSRSEALTDALTGLGNRRALTTDLEDRLHLATDAQPLVLVLYDLDGFKAYNDLFGHPAGDAVLARLGQRLKRSVEGRGNAYRMGGDEFCVLLTPGADVAQLTIDACGRALSETGEGFDVSSSYGSSWLPREADTSVDALRLADKRMYVAKGYGRVSAGLQSKNVLLSALSERDAILGHHVDDVAILAEGVAKRMGLAQVEVEQVRMAAELHDIGKVAIPDAILQKPGPLDDKEWEFIRRHTIIGERILASAPALEPVAKMVRSSHERFDGKGYPDELAGHSIPLGSRIVAVCDAFDAMTTDRSYHPRMSVAAALAELGSCSGGQFDPAVVEAFCAERETRGLDLVQTLDGSTA